MKHLPLLLMAFLAWGGFSPLYVYAQNNSQVITVGENKLGEITVFEPARYYTLQSSSPDAITITARSLTADFAPVILIYGDRQELLAQTRNPARLAEQKLVINPSPELIYLIQILGADGGQGQFVLSIDPEGLSVEEPRLLESEDPIQDR